MMDIKCIVVFIVTFLTVNITCQSYEDKRCRCICPSPATVLNSTLSTDRQIFIANVPPNQCNCDGVILPRVPEEVRRREQEYCPRCECKYESRNTTVIMVVVMIIVWVLTLLLIYSAFLRCLYPLVEKRRQCIYQEASSDETVNLMQAQYMEE